jgi:Ca2+-binding RTX toxin-like protein
MPYITGSNSNDFFYFSGEMEYLSTTITNPYSSASLTLEDEYKVNNSIYDGFDGTDILLMGSHDEALFIRMGDVDEQTVSSVEVIIAGNGGDVIILADETITLDGITVEGGGGEDIIWSNVGDDILNGKEGSDIIDGGPGDDIIDGGPGDDTIDGGDGSDYLQGGQGNDTLNGGNDSDLIEGGAGDDILYYNADRVVEPGWIARNVGSPGVNGTLEKVSLTDMNESMDIFDGGDGFDIIKMTDGDDAIFLSNYFDTLRPEATDTWAIIDIEQIDAGAGNDIVDLTEWGRAYGDIIVNGEEGNDVIWTSSGNDTINGGTGDDNIWGGAGADNIEGGEGDDLIYGGPNSVSSSLMTVISQEHNFEETAAFPEGNFKGHKKNPPAESMGIAEENLSVDFQTTATMTFVESDAGFSNTVGAYTIGADGTILDVNVAFENAKTTEAGAQYTFDVGGETDSSFGFFLIANGYKNNQLFKEGALDGELSFIYDLGGENERLAKITDDENDVTLIIDDGTDISEFRGHIYHSTTHSGSTDINADGNNHVISGLASEGDTSTLRIGFEDLYNLGDSDYNDVVFDLTINSIEEVTLAIEENDVLSGGAGNDTIYGGLGDDIITGGEGQDNLYGNQGEDLFIYNSITDAGDVIHDFEAGSNGDTLDISNVLEGYNSETDDINDFLTLVHNDNSTALNVNADGLGDDAVKLLEFSNNTLGDTATLESLMTNGNLIVDSI